MSEVGLSTALRPRKIRGNAPRKVFSFKLGQHRFAYTTDPGEAGLFNTAMYETRLSAIVREYADGPIIDERNLGSGLVTNAGVLALALDGVFEAKANTLPAKAKEPFNLFARLHWHQWGSKETAANEKDIKLTKAETNKNTGNANKAVEAENKLTASGEGKPKLVSTAKIEAESTLEIKEWGIFTEQLLEATTGSPLTAQTATTGTTTGTALTASSTEAKGETLKILEAAKNEAKEAKPVWGLIRSNSTSVVTVPAWYSEATGAVAEPEKTSAYVIRPVMFDHRTFAVINVVSGNIIEFPWELEIKSGG